MFEVDANWYSVFLRGSGVFIVCDIDHQVEFAKSTATDLEQTMIAALANHGPEKARLLLEKFLYEEEKSGSRATLVRMVVACMSDPRVTTLLPENLAFDASPPLTVLAKKYYFQNAVEAAQEEADPDLRRALLQRACEMSNHDITWLADATIAGSHKLLHEHLFAPEMMLRRH